MILKWIEKGTEQQKRNPLPGHSLSGSKLALHTASQGTSPVPYFIISLWSNNERRGEGHCSIGNSIPPEELAVAGIECRDHCFSRSDKEYTINQLWPVAISSGLSLPVQIPAGDIQGHQPARKLAAVDRVSPHQNRREIQFCSPRRRILPELLARADIQGKA